MDRRLSHNHRRRHSANRTVRDSLPLPRLTMRMVYQREQRDAWHRAVADYLHLLDLDRSESTMTTRDRLLAAHILQSAIADDVRDRLAQLSVHWDSCQDIGRKLNALYHGTSAVREFMRLSFFV